MHVAMVPHACPLRRRRRRRAWLEEAPPQPATKASNSSSAPPFPQAPYPGRGGAHPVLHTLPHITLTQDRFRCVSSGMRLPGAHNKYMRPRWARPAKQRLHAVQSRWRAADPCRSCALPDGTSEIVEAGALRCVGFEDGYDSGACSAAVGGTRARGGASRSEGLKRRRECGRRPRRRGVPVRPWADGGECRSCGADGAGKAALLGHKAATDTSELLEWSRSIVPRGYEGTQHAARGLQIACCRTTPGTTTN